MQKLLQAITTAVVLLSSLSTLWADHRDRYHQPERVMDAVGVEAGMVIGEVGAGRGYFTFKLAERVGDTGMVYANDINRSALGALERRCERDGVTNIETIVGEVEDPRLPEAALDMVFIVNAFHDLERPAALLDNLVPSLKAGARVIIIDRDPEKYRRSYGHFLTQNEVLAIIQESVFELDRVESFLPQHNIYIIRPKHGMR
jgi:ubiquinone/menaquinone biosynthesis C-methylase UbiE